MKPPKGVQPQRIRYRPADLAREHGISPQAVRNYERDGLLPAAERTSSGYRIYTAVHAQALRTFLALVPAHGYPASRAVMRAVNDGAIDAALRTIDESHAGQLRDWATLDAVATAIGALAASSTDGLLVDRDTWTIGEVGRRLGVTPATLRKWERAGILDPVRDQLTGTAATTWQTSAMPSWLTCSDAAATCSPTSRPYSLRSARREARNP